MLNPQFNTAALQAEAHRAGCLDIIQSALGIKSSRQFGNACPYTEGLLSRYLGTSEQTNTVKDLTRIYSNYSQPVLITGQSGSGKELIAKALHGDRKGKFLALNCAAVTESLIESELFGHEKGSFTGAAEKRQGLFEAALNGTIFLDEIGEMPLPTQAKLLRTIQEHTIRRVGSNEESAINCRIVCATHQGLDGRVKARSFRHDLYYRIKMLHIDIVNFTYRENDAVVILKHLMGMEKDEEFPPNSPEIVEEGLKEGGVRYLQQLALGYRIHTLRQPASIIDATNLF